MDCDLCTLAALALILVFGWLLDHREPLDRARKRLLHGARSRKAAAEAAPLH